MLRGEKQFGHELAELVKLEVEFRNDFSNILCVETKLVLLHNDMKTATVKMEYDLEFLVSSAINQSPIKSFAVIWLKTTA